MLKIELVGRSCMWMTPGKIGAYDHNLFCASKPQTSEFALKQLRAAKQTSFP
jgi:hypothetical protein